MSADTGFYQLLYKLIVADDDVIRYRKQMDELRKKIKYIRAKADAEVEFVEKQIAIVGSRENKRVHQMTRTYIKRRRKELGLDAVKKDELKV